MEGRHVPLRNTYAPAAAYLPRSWQKQASRFLPRSWQEQAVLGTVSRATAAAGLRGSAGMPSFLHTAAQTRSPSSPPLTSSQSPLARHIQQRRHLATHPTPGSRLGRGKGGSSSSSKGNSLRSSTSSSSSRRSFGAKASLSEEAEEEVVEEEGLDVEGAKLALANAQAVCFDVDSTVCSEEGIDILADFCGAAEAVSSLTNQAMGGSMLFQDALKARLDLMKPSTQLIAKCLLESPPKLSPGVAELITELHNNGAHVYLVSGGFRLMINPVADTLNIPTDRVYANTIEFAEDGEYKGFDAEEYTSRDGGKPAVVDMLKKKHKYSPVVMIGDGATDMQAKPPADAFIGYGGVVVREKVRAGADWFVRDFEGLLEVVRSKGKESKGRE